MPTTEWMNRYETIKDKLSCKTDMAVSFNYRLLDEFMREWQQRKKELQAGQITKEELTVFQRASSCPYVWSNSR